MYSSFCRITPSLSILVFTHKSAEHKGMAGDSRGIMAEVVVQW
jgi:hypothetical protein